MVTVKLTGTDEINSVPLSSIKLSPQLHGERIERNKELQKLINVLNKHPTNKQSNQFIGLLHGSGGAGKSRVINAVRNYAKNLCNFHKVNFDKRTIMTTALTGVAAVSINGETTHSACKISINNDTKPQPERKEYENTIMIIIDEISFINQKTLETVSRNLNIMVDVDQSKYVFGDLQVLFAGDFGQLHPVSGTALFKAKDNVIWDKVTTYFELKSTHRFKDDPKWGELLQRFRWEGPTADDLSEINKRLTQDSSVIPPNAIYAVYTNKNRASTNKAIFRNYLKKHHKDVPSQRLRDISEYTVCIMSTITQMQCGGKTWHECNNSTKDIIHSCCSDYHATTLASKKQLMLTLYSSFMLGGQLLPLRT